MKGGFKAEGYSEVVARFEEYLSLFDSPFSPLNSLEIAMSQIYSKDRRFPKGQGQYIDRRLLRPTFPATDRPFQARYSHFTSDDHDKGPERQTA
jgi:hypothetical protein